MTNMASNTDSKQASKKPVIRFEEFSGEWEEKKLADEVSFYTGLTYSPENVISKNGTLVLRSSNVQDGVISLNNNVHVSNDVVNSDNVEYNDIIVVVRNGSRNLIGKHALIKSTMPNTVIGAFMTGVRCPHPEFINTLFDTKQFLSAVNSNLGATINQITGGMFKKMEFYFTTPKEQKIIGNFFKKLDKNINLHKRKHKQTQQLKKAMLSKLFPAKGQTQPEIRLDGFSGDWVEKRLGDLGEEYKGGGTPSTKNFSYWNGDIPWIQSSDILEGSLLQVKPRKHINETGIVNSATKLIDANSIAIVTRVGVGKLALIRFTFATSQDFLSISKLNVDCLFAVYSIYLLMVNESKITQGTSIKGITNQVLLDKIVKIPNDIKEQTAIGNFFKQLDDTLALQAQQISTLQQLKKAFLQNMFV